MTIATFKSKYIAVAVAAAISVALAVGAFIAADQHRQEVVDALGDEPVTAITRAGAQRKESLSEDWNLVGWIALGSGVALAVTSVTLFAIGPDARASVHVEATALPDRLVLRGRF